MDDWFYDEGEAREGAVVAKVGIKYNFLFSHLVLVLVLVFVLVSFLLEKAFLWTNIIETVLPLKLVGKLGCFEFKNFKSKNPNRYFCKISAFIRLPK